MSAGDQMRAYYEQWRQRFPVLFAVPLNVLPDSTTGYHITSGVLNGVPQTQVQAGYTVAPWQAAHEILGHMALGLRPALKEPFWTTRFGACQYQVMPRTWARADADSGYGTGGWAYLPIEVYAEAARLAYTTDGPTDRSMDWGCALDAAKMRTFLDSAYGAAISAPTLPPPQKGPSIEWLGPLPATNYEVGRQGHPVSLVVIHWMAGSFDSALSRFMTPGAQVSAHYLISQTGRIAQVIKDGDTAYHAGDFPTNLLSIGIEHEASPVIPPSAALYEASSWLLNALAAKHYLDLIVGTTVVPHRSIVPTACPGTVDLDRLVEGADMTPEQSAKLDRVLALLEAREPLVWQARAQRFLDVERGTAYDPNKPPLDPRIKA